MLWLQIMLNEATLNDTSQSAYVTGFHFSHLRFVDTLVNEFFSLYFIVQGPTVFPSIFMVFNIDVNRFSHIIKSLSEDLS